MYKIIKTFKFPYGHRLSNHKGLCQNIHGHNWKLEVCLMSEKLNKNDMVIDFSDLKNVVNILVCNDLDHSVVLNSKDERTYKHLLNIQQPEKIFFVADGDPTAEKMTQIIYHKINDWIESLNNDHKIEVCFIRLWENDDSYAEYSK